MPRLFLHADFVRPEFHGAAGNGEPEWPPSPLRLAQALVSGWASLGHPTEVRAAVEAMMRLAAPVIHAPSARGIRHPDTYTGHSGHVSSTGVGQLKKVLDLSPLGLSRTNNVAKPVVETVLEGTRVVFELEDPEGSLDAPALDRAAREIGYFGRSRDQCDLWVTTEPGDLPAARWAPVAHRSGRIRGWTPHSGTWMDMKHRAQTEGLDVPPPPSSFFETPLHYVVESVSSRRSPAGNAEEEEVTRVRVFPVDRPVDSHRIPEFMAPWEESGLTLFPCVFSGHPRATGALHGVGVVLPGGQDSDPELGRILLDAQPRLGVDAGRRMTRFTTDPRRWTAASRRWVSATPLRAFPDERVLQHQIDAWATGMHGAQLSQVVTSRTPTEPWQHRWTQRPDGLTNWWISLEFDREVRGPLLVGAATELGFGLLTPKETAA